MSEPQPQLNQAISRIPSYLPAMHLEGRISPSSTIPERLVDKIKDPKKNLVSHEREVENEVNSVNKKRTKEKRMKVGVLTAGHISEGLSQIHGSYLQMYSTLLEDSALEFEQFDVEHGDFPCSVHDCDAWLLSGSVNSANDPDEWIERLVKFIQTSYEAEVPIVGVCFGHQLIAKSLGGRVETYKGGYTAGVRDYLFDGAITPLVASHGDQVMRLPPGAKVVGSAPYCPFAALRYGNKVFSVQPHPEFTPDFMDDLLIKLNVPSESKQRRLALRSNVVGEYIKQFLLMDR